MMADIVIYVGLLGGVAMIATVCIVFARNQLFGLGGSTLSILGTILIGMSVWGKVSVSIGSDGALTAELTQIRENVKELEIQGNKIEKSVSRVGAEIDNARVTLKSIADLASFQLSENLTADGVYGAATDEKLRQKLKQLDADPNNELLIDTVQKLTGKTRPEAQQYIRQATQ